MASTSRNSSQNNNEECESKESLPVGLGAEPTSEEHAAMASSQSFEEHYCYWNNSLPVGFRFKPTDKELVDSYLRVKKFGGGIIYDNIIKDLDIYKHSPSQLKNLAYDHGDGQMYFFSPLHKKYLNGEKVKRDAFQGFWKMTASGSPVYDKDGRRGTKTPLAFHCTKHNLNGVKTQWLMQEYRLTGTRQKEVTKLIDECALCVVYHNKKGSVTQSSDEGDQSSMPRMEISSLNFEVTSGLHSVSSPSSSRSNYVSSPIPQLYQNPNYKPSSSNNNSETACCDPQCTLCPKPISTPYIETRPYPPMSPIYHSHYASSSNYAQPLNYRRAMGVPFSNFRPSTSSHPNFYATDNSTMHTPNLCHNPQQLHTSPRRASFNPNFDMNPSFTQNSYQPSNSNFHGSNTSTMPSSDQYTYEDPINGFVTENFWHNTIQNTGQCYIGNPNPMNHYSNLGTTINAEQYSYNPSLLIPLSNIITNVDNSMNPNHFVDSNPTTSIPNPGANPSMNYCTHPTINTSGCSPSPIPSADLSMGTAPNLDLSGLNNQQEPQE